MQQDARYMNMAIELARAGSGQTSPNPLVGAVIVKNGTVAGMGAHLRAGEPHAEVHALRMAGNLAKDATLYVTLEPCCHVGKTPPCSEAVIQAGISRVVVAALDPNPQVAGGGVEKLRSAGLEVIIGVEEEKAKQLNEVFFHYIQTKRPFVTLKTASTLDGKIATHTGHSKWITGEAARREVHELRRMHDAILIGSGTVLADDPALTARVDGKAWGKQPVRVILDRRLRTPLTAQVVNDRCAETWIVTSTASSEQQRQALVQKGVSVIAVDGGLTVEKVLEVLGDRGITSLLVEGGAEINGAFLQAKAIQKMISYVSLKLIGGRDAPTIFGGEGIASMEEALHLIQTQIEHIGTEDIRITGYPQWK